MTTHNQPTESLRMSRRQLVGVAGVAGVAAAAAAVPPLMAGTAAAAEGGAKHEPRWIEESFYFETPHDTVFATSAPELPLGTFPAGIPLLSEPALRSALIFGGKVHNAAGAVVGFATEQEDILPDSDLANGFKHSRTLWTVFLPGRGTIAFNQIERLPDDVAAAFRQSAQTGQPWVGELDATATVGPGPDGKGVIVGGTGEFAEVHGSGVEHGTLRRIDVAAGQIEGSFDLRLRFRRR